MAVISTSSLKTHLSKIACDELLALSLGFDIFVHTL